METLIETPYEFSVITSESQSLQNQLGLNLCGVEKNTILEWNEHIIGYISIKNDAFFLKINEEAPRIVITAFPRQKQVLFEVANSIEIRGVESQSLEVLAIEASSIDFLANVTAYKEIGLTAKKSLTISGGLRAENIYNKAAIINNTGNLTVSQALTFEAQETIQQEGNLEANTLILHGNTIVTNNHSDITAKESAVIVADSVLMEGNFYPGNNLFFKSRELVIDCSLVNLVNTCFETDILHIKNNGKIEFNTVVSVDDIREIVTKSLILDKGCELKANNLILSSNVVDSQGMLNLDYCNVEAKSLALYGNYSITNSRCVIENKAILSGNKTSVLGHLEFEAESILFQGKTKNQHVNFITDDILFAENSASEFTDSCLEVAYLVSLNEKASTQFKNTYVNAEAMRFSGHASLENCTIECDSLLTSEKIILHACHILAEDFWQDSGAQIDNCEIKAQSTTLQQSTLEHCKLETYVLSYKGVGNISNSNIHVFNYIQGVKNANLTFVHSLVKTVQNYSQGVFNLSEGSYYQTDYMQQSAGHIQVNGATIDNKALLYTFPGTTLVVKSKGLVQLKTALFEGDSSWAASKMYSTGPVMFCGKITGEKAEIVSKDSFYFLNGQQQLKDSVIVSEKDIIANGELTLDKSVLHSKTLFLNKGARVKNSQIFSSDLNVIGKFCAKKSLINLQSALHAFHNGSVTLKAVKVQSQSMCYEGDLHAQVSDLQALENVYFSKNSASNFQTVKLKVGNNLIIQDHSQLSGTALEIKSSHFTNKGAIGIDNLSLEARTIANRGAIDTESLQFKANEYMYNTGSIHSDYIKGQSVGFVNLYADMHAKKSAAIQTPLFLNVFSNLSSNAGLNVDSISHFNLLGTEFAYDMSMRSLTDFNYGTRLPYFPRSYEDIFTWSRALSFGRMAFSQMLPLYSNSIALGAMLLPYAKNSSRFLYDFWKSDASMSALPYKIYDVARTSLFNGLVIKDESDFLPVAMNIMSTGLSAVQLTKCATGTYDEIKSSLQDKVEHTEKQDPKPEPFDLSNLCQATGEIAISALGPSLYLQNVFSHNAGFMASINLTESLFYKGVNDGVKCGWNIIGNYKHGVNQGIIAGANLIATGKTMENSGFFKGFQKSSLLFSDKLVNTALGHLSAANGYIRSKEVVNEGRFNLSQAKLEAENLTNAGKLKFSTLVVDVSENVNFKQTSVSDFQTVKLDVGKNIVNQEGSRLIGKALEAKSTHVTNEGAIAIDALSLKSSTIENTGEINTKNIQFKVNQYMINKGSIESDYIKGQALVFLNNDAKMHSQKSTIIQAPLYLNLLSDQYSDASLNIDSLIHYNFLGAERAFDMSIRSLADFNYGLRLPTLPNSFEDVFNLPRAMTFSRMALSQMFPSFSNLISLGTTTLPYAQKIPGILYDLYNSDASFNDLPTKIYDMARSSLHDYADEFSVNDASDLLPVAMNIMSKGLGTIQFAKSATGAFEEIKLAREEKKTTCSTEDKGTTPEPINILNLSQMAGEMAIKALGPSLYTQAVYGYNVGLASSINLTESVFNDFHFGVKCGWNISSNFNSGENHGIFAGGNLVTTGQTFKNSGILMGSQKATLLFTDSLINAATGRLDLKNCYVRSQEVLNDGSFNLNRGRLEAENLISRGKANLSILTADVSENIYFTKTSTTNFQTVKLEAGGNIISQTGSQLSGTALQVKANHFGNDGAIAIRNLLADANTIYNSSEVDTENIHLKAVESILNQGSIFSDDGVCTTTHMGNEGAMVSNNLLVDSSTIDNNGKIYTKNNLLKADESIHNGGSIVSSELVARGKTLKNSGHLVVSQKADLSISDKIINENGRLSLNNHTIKTKEFVDTGSLNLNGGELKADNVTFGGNAHLSRFTAKASENITFTETSSTDFQGVSLEAGKNIVSQAGALLSGSALKTKSNVWRNEGSIALDDLFLDASVINNSGEIDNKNLNFKASQYVYNTGSINSDYIKGQSVALFNVAGGIHSKNKSTIQAPLYFNLGGNQSSYGNLDIDSLVHVNLFGSQRAYDMNIRTVIDINCGLRLPYLPSSFEEFTYSRVMNFGRMALSLLVPGYSNVISLGSMALPHVKNVPTLLYNCYKSDVPLCALPRTMYDFTQSSWNELIKELPVDIVINDASDLLPAAMDIMSKGLSVTQFAKCVTGAFDEISKASQNNNDIVSSEGREISEKSVATRVPNDLSNPYRTAGDIALTAFGPSINVQTVFGYDLGLTLAANLTESTLYQSNFGVKGGWNINSHYTHGKNHGIYAGANVVATGITLENSGIFVNSQKAALLFTDKVINTSAGSMSITNASIESKEFIKDGYLTMNNGNIDVQTIASNGQSNFSAVEINAEHVDMKGDYNLTVGSTLIADTVTLQGGNINHSTVIGKESVIQTGHCVLEGGIIDGNNVNLSTIGAKYSKIDAKQNLDISNSNTLDTSINGKVLNLQDSAFRARPIFNESIEQPNLEPGCDDLTHQEPKSSDHADTANQIHASESITTQNVIFEGQTITTNTFNLVKSSMENCDAKVASDIIIQRSNVANSNIDTNKAIIRENNSFSETITNAAESIDFENSDNLKTHNAQFNGDKNIAHNASNHSQTGFLIFKAKNVQTSKTSNLYSGEGESNVFYVEAETGNFEGKMRLDNGIIDVKDLNNAEDFIGQKGQSENQVFTKSLAFNVDSSINLENMQPRGCELTLIAKSINVKMDYKTNNNLNLIAKEGKLSINANVSGNKVVLESEQNDIELNGKTVEGKTYVYASAAGDIKDQATERELKGKYGVEKVYSQGTFVGGAGNEDTGNAGVILMAGKKVLVDASNVIAEGKTIVSGKKGVEFKARSHQYIDERKTKYKKVLGIRHGKKTTEKTKTQISTSTLGSKNDKIIVISSEGEVTGAGVNFIAEKGAEFDIHGEVKLKSLIVTDSVKKRETGAFRLNSSKKNETHQSAKCVEFVSNGGETRFHSHTANIEGTDLRFSGRGNVTFETPEGAPNLRASKLNHIIETSERKFSLHTPIMDTINSIRNDSKQMSMQIEPVVGNIQALLNANSSTEILTGVSNLAVNGYNMANSLASGTYDQQLMQKLGFVSKASMVMTQTESSTKYQTGTGAGFFLEEGDVSFNAKKTVNLEGIPMAADNLNIQAEKFIVSGQSFDSSHSKDTLSATLGMNLTGGGAEASISQSSQQMNAKQYQNVPIKIRNHVQIEVQEAVLDAANISCNTIGGNIDKLTVKTRQDEFKQNSSGGSLSTTGAVSVNQGHAQGKQVNQTAGIHVTSDIKKENLQVREANLIGGVVTSDGYNDFAPETLNTATLKDTSHTSGFSISGNLNSIGNVLNNSGDNLPSQLTTIKVAQTTTDYKARHYATVFGKEGVNSDLAVRHSELNTSKQSRKVMYDKSQTIALDVPVEVVNSSMQSGLQFFKPATQLPSSIQEKPEGNVLNIVTRPQKNLEVATPEAAIEIVITSELPMEKIERTPIQEVVLGSSSNAVPEDLHCINNMKAFNPLLQTQTLGLKQGRNSMVIYNKDNGQYTNLEKELQSSIESNRIITHVKTTLFEGGSKADGYYYNGKFDALNNQLIIDAGLGKQYTFNLDSRGVDLGLLGALPSRVDAFTAEALVNAKMKMNPTSATIILGGSVGVMGPSAGMSYNTPELKVMGLTFQLSADVSGGVGIKLTGAIGAEVDVSKMKTGCLAKLGLFSGLGCELKLRPSVGLDMKYIEGFDSAYQEIVKEDAYGMSLIEKLKNHEILTQEQRVYFDVMMDEVSSKAQFSSWFVK